MTDGRVLSEKELKEIERAWIWAQPAGLYQCVDINKLASLSDHIPNLLATIRDYQRQVSELTETVEVLQENMVQGLGYMAMCPECRTLLPEHSSGCALNKALHAPRQEDAK